MKRLIILLVFVLSVVCFADGEGRIGRFGLGKINTSNIEDRAVTAKKLSGERPMDISLTNYRSYGEYTIDEILNGTWIPDHRNPVMDMAFFSSNGSHTGGAPDPRVIDGDLVIFHEQQSKWAVPGLDKEDIFMARFEGAGWENLIGNHHIGHPGRFMYVNSIEYPSGSPIVINTLEDHGLSTGDLIGILSADTDMNNDACSVTVTDSNSFTLDGTDGDNGDPNIVTAQVKEVNEVYCRVAPRVLWIPEEKKYIMWHGDYNSTATNWDYTVSESNNLERWYQRLPDTTPLISDTSPHKEVVRIDDTIYIFGGAPADVCAVSNAGYYTQSVDSLDSISSWTNIDFGTADHAMCAGSLVKCSDGWIAMGASDTGADDGETYFWSATDSGFPDTWTLEGNDSLNVTTWTNTAYARTGGTYTYDDEGYRNPAGLLVNGIPMLILPIDGTTNWAGQNLTGGNTNGCAFFRLGIGSTHRKKILDLSMLGVTASTTSTTWSDGYMQSASVYKEFYIDPQITGQEWELRGRLGGNNLDSGLFRLYDTKNSKTLFQFSGEIVFVDNFGGFQHRFMMPPDGYENQRWEFEVISSDGTTTVTPQLRKSEALRALVPIDRLPKGDTGSTWTE